MNSIMDGPHEQTIGRKAMYSLCMLTHSHSIISVLALMVLETVGHVNQATYQLFSVNWQVSTRRRLFSWESSNIRICSRRTVNALTGTATGIQTSLYPALVAWATDISVTINMCLPLHPETRVQSLCLRAFLLENSRCKTVCAMSYDYW